MSLLRFLALSYLASASVFFLAASLVAHPRWAGDVAKRAIALKQVIDSHRLELFTWQSQPSPVARLDLAPVAAPASDSDRRTWAHAQVIPPKQRQIQEPEATLKPPVQPMPDQIAIVPDLEQAPAEGTSSLQSKHNFSIPNPPAADGLVSSRSQIVAARFVRGLTPEMIQNFDLFVYVSKANAGPVSQRMYVFAKMGSGDLRLLYDWAASTGREQHEVSPHGEHTLTVTPVGYYELDPDRMYRHYHSYGWDQDMPDAMFFNWERDGLQTGLAIHAATGTDIPKLGTRASAGCVHLAPKNAAILFNLIRTHYRGTMPRLAFDDETQTMSNRGEFMHDQYGNLKMTNGYRVLVRIDDYGGGDDAVAALF